MQIILHWFVTTQLIFTVLKLQSKVTIPLFFKTFDQTLNFFTLCITGSNRPSTIILSIDTLLLNYLT